jgi:16S rRNA (cytosine967-C5)-methyltransferase
VRGTAVAIYARATRSWHKAPAEIARGLREARALHSRERRFVADTVHAMVRMRRNLAFAAGLDDAEAASPSPELLYLTHLAIAHADPVASAELSRAGVEVRLADAPQRLQSIADPVRRLALTHSYPDWLVAALRAQLGDERVELALAASNRRAPLCARANRLKIDRDELMRRLAKEEMGTRPVELAPDALELTSHHNAYALEAFREGLFELQDPSSQLIGEVVAPPPRGRLLDLCAGAGGNSLHLAALLGGGGRIVAADVAPAKLEELRRRARRAGVTNLETHLIPPKGPLPFEGPFDRVLVDAPCTGTGVLRRNPEARWRLRPTDLVELPALQAEILARAAPLVRAGGRLVYATCSVLDAENDAVVDRFIVQNPEFEPVLIKEILGSDRALSIGDGARLRTAPERQDMDGFFAAVLRRR